MLALMITKFSDAIPARLRRSENAIALALRQNVLPGPACRRADDGRRAVAPCPLSAAESLVGALVKVGMVQHGWLSDRDSNPDSTVNSRMSYRWTI